MPCGACSISNGLALDRFHLVRREGRSGGGYDRYVQAPMNHRDRRQHVECISADSKSMLESNNVTATMLS